MNIKNYTSFLSRVVFATRLIFAIGLSSLLFSCNAIQMISGEETKAPKYHNGQDYDSGDQNGNDQEQGPAAYKVLFDVGSPQTYPYILDTGNGDIHQLAANALNPKNYTFFKGKIYFQGNDGMYEEFYSHDTGTHSPIKITAFYSANTIPSAVHNDTLYYVANGGSLCGISEPSDGVGTCSGAGNFNNVEWMRHNSVDGKLYACLGASAPGTLEVIDAANATMSQVVPAGHTNMPCDPSSKPLFHNGQFMYLDSGSIKVYDSSNNGIVEVTGLGSMSMHGITKYGNAFIHESGFLKKFSFSDGSFVSLGISDIPVGNVMESPDELLMILNNGDGDEIFKMPKWDSAGLQPITDFNLPGNGLYFGVGPSGFYLFHTNGIERQSLDGASETVFTGAMGSVFDETHQF